MDSLSFRFEDGEIRADLFNGEDCVDSISITLDDAVAVRQSLDAAILEALKAANDP